MEVEMLSNINTDSSWSKNNVWWTGLNKKQGTPVYSHLRALGLTKTRKEYRYYCGDSTEKVLDAKFTELHTTAFTGYKRS